MYAQHSAARTSRQKTVLCSNFDLTTTYATFTQLKHFLVDVTDIQPQFTIYCDKAIKVMVS